MSHLQRVYAVGHASGGEGDDDYPAEDAPTSSRVPVLTEPLSRGSCRADMALYGVHEIAKVLCAAESLDTTLGRVVNILSSFMEVRHAVAALLAEDGTPQLVVGSGWIEDDPRASFDLVPERVIGQMVVSGMPMIIDDVRTASVFAGATLPELVGSTPTAFIGVPICTADQPVDGVLLVDRGATTDIEEPTLEEDARFLGMVASLISQTVRLNRLAAKDRERLLAEKERLATELERVQEQPPELARIVGRSGPMMEVIHKVRVVARSSSTVLLRGESGTGKELFARAIHDLSPRHAATFVPLNCAALPETVLESELFGHERGAFTGATTQRRGRFELADGGTLFLDEIGEISPAFQAKLLRVLQEGEFERVGGTRTLKVNVRLVAATNRDLEADVARGTFRADLYYRINVVPIVLPPLRERPQDIPALAREFLRRYNDENSAGLTLGPDALETLGACGFPGNVRELENCVRRTATLAGGPTIGASDFACSTSQCGSSSLWKLHRKTTPPPAPTFVPLPIARVGMRNSDPPPSGHSGDDERLRLVEAMEQAGWVQAKAARLLGLTPRQIGYALKKHDIPIKRF